MKQSPVRFNPTALMKHDATALAPSYWPNPAEASGGRCWLASKALVELGLKSASSNEGLTATSELLN